MSDNPLDIQELATIGKSWIAGEILGIFNVLKFDLFIIYFLTLRFCIKILWPNFFAEHNIVVQVQKAFGYTRYSANTILHEK